MTDDELIEDIEAQRVLMMEVAVGRADVGSKNPVYLQRRTRITDGLRSRTIPDPNPYKDLWAWSATFGDGGTAKGRERHDFISHLHHTLAQTVRLCSRTTGFYSTESMPPRVVGVDRE
jgi:hypothetical protein